MQIASDIVRVHLLDLSASGARVHCTTPLAIDTVVRLDCGLGLRLGRVSWIDGKRLGVSFKLPFSDDQVSQILDGLSPKPSADL